ncbi:MAG: PIG-L family deacetylase, partial [Chitinophagaceae bacterium]|nr:PIG-L family deacetylase [Chitinophagaceae bacterium]
MKNWLYFILLVLLPVFHGKAQAPVSYNAANIYQRIAKLKVLGAVLYVAAHPDDENTRLLGWLSNERLYRTGYLSLTRGDGGQNLIGDEQGIELGLIRTQELLAARRIDGAEQFFSSAFDFGFSKSTDEALRIWGKERVLADAVWVIRNFQPDVIITRFPPDNRAGHGHHSASSVIAAEAFKAAADPKRFPEQFKYGVKPWQAKRIFWNSYNFGGADYTSENQLKANVGGYNTMLGKSYGEIAAESRSQHKSQGFGVPASRGSMTDYFSFTDGSPAESDLMQDVNTAWSRINATNITLSIDNILKNYRVNAPGASVPALVKLYKEINALPDGYWKNIKLKELKDIIAAASGLWLEAFTIIPKVTQGEKFNINISINNRDGAVIQVKNISIENKDTVLNVTAATNSNINFVTRLKVDDNKNVSQPYWLVNKMNSGSFNIT